MKTSNVTIPNLFANLLGFKKSINKNMPVVRQYNWFARDDEHDNTMVNTSSSLKIASSTHSNKAFNDLQLSARQY